MQRAPIHAAGTALPDAAAVEAVAPLMQLMFSSRAAAALLRYNRMLELLARALAAAESSQPPESLIIATVLNARISSAIRSAPTGSFTDDMEAFQAACRKDDQVLLLSQRCQAIMSARWRAGSLFALTPQEYAYFFAWQSQHPNSAGASMVICAMSQWPAPRTPAEQEAHTHHVHDGLLALLALAWHGFPDAVQSPITFHFNADHFSIQSIRAANKLLAAVFNDAAAGLLTRLRATCGLTLADEAALRHLAFFFKRFANESMQRARDLAIEMQANGAADVARHGLRRCALPSCGATEPHPKLFKLCGRCRGAAYCCAAHSAEDWKRHKREDGCKATP
jgi:hypothetical protein